MKHFLPAILRISFYSILLTGLLVSCKKDTENNDNPSGSQVPFSVEYTGQRPGNYGWVVLHDLSGNTVQKFMKYNESQLLDFGDVTVKEITVTRIDIDTITLQSGQRLNINITTDFAAPSGAWKIKGYSEPFDYYGTAEITVTYPTDEYDKALLATSASANIKGDVPPDQITFSRELHARQGNSTFSIYCAVYKDEEGLCNWLFNEEIPEYTTDYYDLILDKTLIYKTINTNIPVSNISLRGHWDDRSSNINIYYDFDSGSHLGPYKHQLFYHDEMPISEVSLRVSDYNDEYSFSYTNFFAGTAQLPEDLPVPEDNIDGYIDVADDTIYVISVPETADQISGFWSYFNFQNNPIVNISWFVKAPAGSDQLYRPDLPQEIIDEIGDLLNKLEISSIGMVNYDNTANHSDIIRRDYINNIPNPPDETYWYNMRLGDGKVKIEHR
jgi:hypothetical protein